MFRNRVCSLGRICRLGIVERFNSTSLSVAKSNDTTQATNTDLRKSFAKMFKQSKFVALGDLENKYLIGRIVDICGDDLYIDYGGKFNCICKKPTKNADNYIRNANVKIKLQSFEMASYFLNSARHLTLLESDAELVGLVRRSDKGEKDERNETLLQEIDELNSEPYN